MAGASRALALLGVGVFVGACSDGAASASLDGEPIGDASIDSGTSDAGESTGSLDAAGRTVTVEGDYYRFYLDRDGRPDMPVGGAEACMLPGGPPICDTTDSTGRWSLHDVPALRDLELRLTADGFVPSYRLVHVPGRDLALFAFSYASNDLLGYLFLAAEETSDPARGMVTFEAMRGTVAGLWLRDVEGASATLRSTAPSGESYAASYANDMQIPLAGLTATTSAGLGYFANVRPGEYVLVVTHPTRSCEAHPILGWRPTEPGMNATARVPVHAGAVTFATVLCPD